MKKFYPESLPRARARGRAFTLIEVLIATMLLAMIVGAAALIEKQNLTSGSYNKHKLQATGLAQEGLNLTRSIRDTNLINTPTKPWENMGGDNPDKDKSWKLENSTGQWKLIQVPTDQNTVETIPLNGIEYTRKIYVEAP